MTICILMLVDLFGFARTVLGTNHDLHEFLILGGVTIELWEEDTVSHDNPQAGFVHDGVHPHTHLQGIMANLFAAALNGGYDAELPVLGICLGSQLLAKALGAKVFANPVKEIGWYRIELTPEAAGDRLFAGCDSEATVFQWHGDTFELPAGAVQFGRE